MTRQAVIRHAADGTQVAVNRPWVPEAAIALEYNGLGYAVMMASPDDLADFSIGFAITEGLAASVSEVGETTCVQLADGWVVRTELAGLPDSALQHRVRTRIAESSCGLCGVENLAAAARPLPPAPPHQAIDAAAIFSALAMLPARQSLTRRTGAAHAAALCGTDGQLLCLREDVGRHNAVDKLVGAAAQGGLALDQGFVLSTARCSFEIVEKAVRAGAATLVCISLPTTLAVERAKAAGLSLWALARSDSVLLINNAST